MEFKSERKTALQEILDQIKLFEAENMVYLLPTITKQLIETALIKEREQIMEAFVAGSERGTKDIPFNCEQYYSQTFDNKLTT